MLKEITVLTSIIFASLYSLCFWISHDEPLKEKFHHFHMGLPCMVAGIFVILSVIPESNLFLKSLLIFWGLLFLVVCSLNWKKEFPSSVLMTLPSVVGLYIFSIYFIKYLEFDLIGILMGILAGAVLCSCIYAMNLGHWYLNVKGLNPKHLKRSVNVFAVLLLIRLVVDIYFLFSGTVLFDGENISLFKFLGTLDGFLLSIGIFFGTLFPFLSIYFVKETIRLKNTNSATGILYVVLCSVFIGDLAYKYYLIKFGIFL